MSVTTTQCHPVKVNVGSKVLRLKLKKPQVFNNQLRVETSVPSNSDAVSDVFENIAVKELAAALERLEMEKENVIILRSKFYSDKKLAISSKSFKDEVTSSDTAAVVKIALDKTRSCFRQYSDCLHELYDAVAGEYNKRKEKTEVINSVKCLNEQLNKKDSESLVESKISDYVAKLPLLSFEINSVGIRDHIKILNFSRYCRELASRFLLFKKSFNSLPSDFDMADYNSWERKVFDIFYSEISKYAANFKLLREVATQEKMEVYLKSTSSLLSNLVINIPSVNWGNIGAKRKLHECF